MKKKWDKNYVIYKRGVEYWNGDLVSKGSTTGILFNSLINTIDFHVLYHPWYNEFEKFAFFHKFSPSST